MGKHFRYVAGKTTHKSVTQPLFIHQLTIAVINEAQQIENKT